MPCSDLPTESCMSRANRARSSAAPTAATAAATSSRASTALATAERISTPMITKLTTSAGVPASRASHPVHVSGRVPSRMRGAPSDPTRQGGRQHDQEPAGEQQTGQQGGADHRERRRVAPQLDAHQQSRGSSAMSTMASSGCRMSTRIGRLPSPKIRLARASSSRLSTDVAEGCRTVQRGQDCRGGQQQAQQPGVEDPAHEPEVAGIIEQRVGPGVPRPRPGDRFPTHRNASEIAAEVDARTDGQAHDDQDQRGRHHHQGRHQGHLGHRLGRLATQRLGVLPAHVQSDLVERLGQRCAQLVGLQEGAW